VEVKARTINHMNLDIEQYLGGKTSKD